MWRELGGLWLFLEKNSTCSKEKALPLLRTSYKPISVRFNQKKVKNFNVEDKKIYIYIYKDIATFFLGAKKGNFLLAIWAYLLGPSQAMWGIGFNQGRFKRT